MSRDEAHRVVEHAQRRRTKKTTTLSDHHPDNYSAIVLDMSLYHLELFIAYIYIPIYIYLYIYVSIYICIFPSEFPLGNGGARAQNQGSFSTFFLKLHVPEIRF
jgi:hypothetical protein